MNAQAEESREYEEFRKWLNVPIWVPSMGAGYE
jgi:hypothetical protein